jgi:hypothetical protein
VPESAPIMIPTADVTTLPLVIKVLKSFGILSSFQLTMNIPILCIVDTV